MLHCVYMLFLCIMITLCAFAQQGYSVWFVGQFDPQLVGCLHVYCYMVGQALG